MPITLKSRAITPGEALYASDFSTDRTADFSAGVRYDPAATYANLRPVDADYLYATQPGAIGVGVGSPGSVVEHIDIPVRRGDQPAIYMLLWNAPAVFCDIIYSWWDSAGAQIGREKVDNNQNYAVEKSQIGVAPQDGYLRISWMKKNSGTGGVWICGLRVQNCVGYLPPNFLRSALSIKRRPNPLCALIAVGKPKTIDFSNVVSNTEKVEVALPEVIATGQQVTFTATSAKDSGSNYEGIDYKVDAYSKGHRSTDRLTCFFKAIDPIPFEKSTIDRNWAPDYYVENNRWFAIDFISRVQGGLWPYSAKIIQKPSWLVEGISGKGFLRGQAPIVAQPQTAIVVDVMDSLGQVVRFSEKITVVTRRSRVPNVTLSGGTLSNPTNIYVAAGLGSAPSNAPFVVKLTEGSGHFTFGTPWGYRRPNNAPLIIIGGGVDTRTTVGMWSQQGIGGVIFEDVEFNEGSYAGNPDVLGDRNRYTVSSASPRNQRSEGHNFFYGCGSKGWKSPDLSLEQRSYSSGCFRMRSDPGNAGTIVFNGQPTTTSDPVFLAAKPIDDPWVESNYPRIFAAFKSGEVAHCFRVRNDPGFEGQVVYNGDPDRATDPIFISALRADDPWVRNNYPAVFAEFGHAYYNGGFQAGAPTIYENCSVEECCMGFSLDAHSSALIDCMAQDIRTDVLRFGTGAQGVYIGGFTTPVRSHRGNRGSDEHPDLMQGVISGNVTTVSAGYPENWGNASPCMKRVEIRNCAFIAPRSDTYTEIGIQGWQNNGGWPSDADNPKRDPRLSFEDIWVFDTLVVADAPNVIRATFGDWHFVRCWMTSPYDIALSMDNGKSAVRSVAAAYVEVVDSIISRINDESEIKPTLSGSTFVSTLTPSAVMPDIGKTGLTLLQRHRIDPAWAAANPGKGPQWLIAP